MLPKKFISLLDKERIPTVINDKFYLLEEEYKKKGVPYSPFLMFSPEELYKKSEDKIKEEDFDYYKRQILLENYDEEPESALEILKKIKVLKSENSEGKIYGFTKWFDHNGKQIWKRCVLNSYDEEAKLFHISIFPENSTNEIKKKVTRFNYIFEKDNPEDIKRRVSLSEKWRERAKKYMALIHFVNSFDTGKIPQLINQSFIDKILYLVFLYRAPNKPQMTPLELEALDNTRRFGIWRRNVRKRVIDVDKKKLEKILSSKIFDFEVFNEIKLYYENSFKNMEFYKRLPINYDLFVLLKDILPKDKFLMPSEQFLNPSFRQGTLELERGKPYLEVFKDMEHKLHCSEKDLYNLLSDVNRKLLDDFKELYFFYSKWKFKPINQKDFLIKNEENIESYYKEIKYVVSNSNFLIMKNLEARRTEVKKFNKDAR
jgi:hypothetical protein